MNKFCIYADKCTDAPCIVMKMYKYSYLNDFLSDKRHSKGQQQYSLPLTIKCLKREEDEIHRFSVNNKHCINCMFCVFGCIGNRIKITEDPHPTTFCYDISAEELNELRENFLSRLFKGNLLKLKPVQFNSLKVEYKNFEQFTATKETQNIAFGQLMPCASYQVL